MTVCFPDTKDSHLKIITSTKCCIHTVVPADNGLRYARNMYRLTKYTKNKCVSSWFFFAQLYQNARSTKHKKKLLAYFRYRNLLFQNPANWLWSTSNVGYGPYLSRLPSSCNWVIFQYWLCQFLLHNLMAYIQMRRLHSFEWESYNEWWTGKEAGIFTLLENY